MANQASGKGMLKVLQSSDPGFESAFEELCRRREELDESVDRTVRKIVERVREEETTRSSPIPGSWTAPSSMPSR